MAATESISALLHAHGHAGGGEDLHCQVHVGVRGRCPGGDAAGPAAHREREVRHHARHSRRGERGLHRAGGYAGHYAHDQRARLHERRVNRCRRREGLRLHGHDDRVRLRHGFGRGGHGAIEGLHLAAALGVVGVDDEDVLPRRARVYQPADDGAGHVAAAYERIFHCLLPPSYGRTWPVPITWYL